MKIKETFLSDLAPVRRALDAWRKTRKRCQTIPESLWTPIAALACAHGGSQVSQALRLDCLAAIAVESDWQLGICPAVRDDTKRLRDATTGELAPVDIAPLISSGLLQVLHLKGVDEQALYVEQSIAVDDG